MKILSVNCGSSSVKWKVFERGEREIAAGHVDRLNGAQTFSDALSEIFATARKVGIDAIAHRVVHGGEAFDSPTLIDEDVIGAIERAIALAPLHNPVNLRGIQLSRDAFPDLPQVAVFDTAFHATLPRRARTYAIARDLALKHGFRRYGFHGVSHSYIAKRAADSLRANLDELRLITCHLGNGASIAAVEFGRSIETSMGYTPREGLVMGTRSGDLDPSIVLELLRSGERSVEEVESILDEKSGLLGLSGSSRDLRDLEALAASGDDAAGLAIEVFAHRVRKYIGAYAAVMGGVDAIVLTGGIGENGASMRRRILQRFEFLGLVLDEDKNNALRVSAESDVGFIHADHARTRAIVVKTDEEKMIALEARKVLEAPALPEAPRPIPIAISARHVHLDRATLDALFGEGAELTPRSELSQPGQYACEEKVNLIGPRGRIDGVRVLGPLRSQTQVEISRTDEFRLGVDAPIRPSGHLEGSAPITLEGPAGTVHLEEGLICALRHIHMHPDDAAAYGVQDNDVVEVAITGGPRDLVFGDVQVRVNPNFRLEMHIDTDEGNAAELSSGAEGHLAYTAAAAGAGILRKKIA